MSEMNVGGYSRGRNYPPMTHTCFDLIMLSHNVKGKCWWLQKQRLNLPTNNPYCFVFYYVSPKCQKKRLYKQRLTFPPMTQNASYAIMLPLNLRSRCFGLWKRGRTFHPITHNAFYVVPQCQRQMSVTITVVDEAFFQ